jgi:lipoic acid synthetase
MVTSICAPGRLSERHAVKVQLRRANLHTVCEEARCPNICECFGAQTATFLILGDVCTRHCRFCAITKDRPPKPVDQNEPQRVAQAVLDLDIAHAVITSVTRDDLEDGGAGHFVDCIEAIRKKNKNAKIEVLVPDFKGDLDAVGRVCQARPDVFNHNLETVPRLYPKVRPEAFFYRSLNIIEYAASNSEMVVKSGIMVGLGENLKEVVEVLKNLKNVGCKIVTIGQYLQPNKDCLEVKEKISPEQFLYLEEVGKSLGLNIVANTLVRSSYKAKELCQLELNSTNKDTI